MPVSARAAVRCTRAPTCPQRAPFHVLCCVGRLDNVCADPRSYVQRRRRSGDTETEFICVVYQIPVNPLAGGRHPELRLHAALYFARTPPFSFVAMEPSPEAAPSPRSPDGGDGDTRGRASDHDHASGSGSGELGSGAASAGPARPTRVRSHAHGILSGLGHSGGSGGSPKVPPGARRASLLLTRVEEHPQFERLWRDFLSGDDAYRAARWKVFPHLARGSWVVSSAMGTRPAILAHKLAHLFHVTDRCTEVDCDVGESLSIVPAISTLVGLLQQFASSLAIDVAFAVEAQTPDELPEVVLGSVRVHYIDPSLCPEVTAVPEAL